MTSRAVPLLALLLAAGVAAAPAVVLEPLAGVTRVEARPGGWTLEVPGGIGRFRLRVPPGARTEIDLRYAEGRPFTRLEGVQLDGRPAEEGRLAVFDGVARVRFAATAEARDLIILVIDYYR